MSIELLLAHADDSRPALEEGLPESAAAQAVEAGAVKAGSFRDESEDPNLLSAQQWGLIAPQGPVGDRLLALIEPLRKAREEAQGRPPRIYRVAPDQSIDDALKWKKQVYWDESVPEEELPWYVLVLGDFDQVSFELQQVLGNDTFIGRLAFRNESDYEAYVAKLLRWERGEPIATGARQLFYTVRDGTAATTVGYSALMSPSLARCRESSATGNFLAKEILEIEGTPGSMDELLRQAAAADPALLFSMSHGLGAPRAGWTSTDEQRAVQGAMSLGAGQRLTGDDIKNKPFLPGGMWFFFACFGAGTPAKSDYHHWLSRLRDAGMFGGRLDSVLKSLPRESDRPFVAALPQAALANPDGPLAVMGHVDLAWSYSFQDLGKTATNRISRFQGILRSLTSGSRAGVAYRELLRFLSQTNFELSAMLDQEALAETRGAPLPNDAARMASKANLWMLRQDLSGYILLGDPAAQLPIKQRKDAGKPAGLGHETAPAPAPAMAAAPARPPAAAASPGTPAAPARNAEEIEEAVMAVFSGDQTEKEIALKHKVSLSELRRWVKTYQQAGREAVSRLA
jgi:hypothetical protein